VAAAGASVAEALRQDRGGGLRGGGGTRDHRGVQLFLAAPNSVKHSEQKENKLWTKVNQAPTIAHHPRRRGMSLINRSFFFTQARRTMFSNNLRQSQVDGINAILDGWEAKYAVDDDRWLAYALATTYHETDQHMQPIEEYGKGRGLPYGKVDLTTGQVYYGRGFVQLTWARNYKTVADLLGGRLPQSSRARAGARQCNKDHVRGHDQGIVHQQVIGQLFQ
jgi:hypothetical protein